MVRADEIRHSLFAVDSLQQKQPLSHHHGTKTPTNDFVPQ